MGIHSLITFSSPCGVDTDIIAGIETEIDTILVLSGVTTVEGMNKFPYRPKYVLDGVGEIVGAKVK